MNMLLTVLIVLLCVAAVALLRLSKSGAAWAKPAAMVCSLAVIVLALVRVFSGGASGGRAPDASYEAACGEYLGQSLAARHPGARVVVLTLPQAASAGHQALLGNLRSVLETAGLTVTLQPIEMPEELKARFLASEGSGLTPEEREQSLSAMAMEPLMWFDARQLCRILVELEGRADLVISTAELPFPLNAAALPRKGSGPALALLNARLPDLPKALQATVLDTVVMPRDNPDAWGPDAKVPTDTEVAFHQRYVLVNRENVNGQ